MNQLLSHHWSILTSDRSWFTTLAALPLLGMMREEANRAVPLNHWLIAEFRVGRGADGPLSEARHFLQLKRKNARPGKAVSVRLNRR